MKELDTELKIQIKELGIMAFIVHLGGKWFH